MAATLRRHWRRCARPRRVTRRRESLPRILCLLLTLIMLPDVRITRLVTVVLVVQRVLLFVVRIAIPRVVALVIRQRCGDWRSPTIPTVPIRMAPLPVVAPVIAPPRSVVRAPSVEIVWRRPVVPD